MEWQASPQPGKGSKKCNHWSVSSTGVLHAIEFVASGRIAGHHATRSGQPSVGETRGAEVSE